MKVDLKLQSSLETFVSQSKWNNQDPKSKQADNALAKMIVLDDLPFSVVENPGFLEYTHVVISKFLAFKNIFYQMFAFIYLDVRIPGKRT